ncbi:MAG: tRNA lysidine(34) synthetase TilS [Pseudomonadota bacterium]
MTRPHHASLAVLPIGDSEVDALFSDLGSSKTVVIAVSGGRDSLALVGLLKVWVDRRRAAGKKPPDLHSVTVDHGIRPEAGDEAQHAAAVSAQIGIPHTTLTLDLSPATNAADPISQNQARNARYEALCEHAIRIGADALVTGHHLEDQAETLLMRLARGSGVRGLAGMKAHRSIRDTTDVASGVTLYRPLLGVSRKRLTATLEAAGIDWCDDPSNDNPTYERARIAAAQDTLDQIGLTKTSIFRTATRLRDADDALDWTTRHALQDIPELRAAWHEAAWAVVPQATFSDWPTELAVRALEYLLTAVGGTTAASRTEPLSRSRLEGLAARIRSRTPFTVTFAGCRLAATELRLEVFREPGRDGLPIARLKRDGPTVWDARFVMTGPTTIGDQGCAYAFASLEKDARFDVEALRAAKQADTVFASQPRHAALALPLVIAADALIVPITTLENAQQQRDFGTWSRQVVTPPWEPHK